MMATCLASQPLLAQAANTYVFQVPFEAPNTAAGTQGKLSVIPGSHSFGVLAQGGTAVTTAILKNTGQDAVNVSGINVTAPYTVAYDCPSTLQGGASCHLSVVFAPETVGTFDTPVTIQSDVAGAGTQLELSGTAVSPTTNLSVSPNALDLAGVTVGMSGTMKSLTVTNYGNSTATVSGIGIADGGADFSQSNDCAQLAPGAKCTVNVGFTPTTYGPRTANLVLFDQASSTMYPVALTGTGNAADLVVNPGATNFPGTVIDSTATQTVSLTNNGNQTLEAITATFADTGAGFSIASAQCGTSLAAGATCTLTAAFTPLAAGAATTTLTIGSANAAPKSVTLSGTGVAHQQSLAVTPNPLVLNPAEVGSSAPIKSLELLNTGNVAVTITDLAMLTGATDFSQTNNCGALAVGAKCTVNAQFRPTARGARTGSIFLRYGQTETTISLTGQGLQGVAAFTPAAVDFGNAQVGQAATARTITLTNAGDAPLVVSSVSVPTSEFTASTTCATVAVGATCTIVTTFAPTTLGVKTQSLSVTAVSGSYAVPLTGNGVQGFASVSPGTVTYQPQQTGSTSTTQAVTVSNTGTSPLTLSGLSIISGAADFAQSNNCASLAVGASCTVNVTFTPSVDGARTGTLAMTHDGNGVSTVELNGQGRAQAATLGSATFAATPVGQARTATATLTNTGVGVLTVTPPTATPPGGSAFSFVSTTCGTTLAAGANCTSTLRFAPLVAGGHTGVFSLNTGAGTQSTSLSGTAIEGNASVSQTALTFAGVQVASTSPSQAVTVTNTGSSTLTFTGIGLVEGATDFAQTNNCATLEPESTCQVTVNFTPTATGGRSGQLAMAHDGSGVTTVTLSGVGQAPSGTLTSPSFSATAVGSSSTALATLTNTGLGALSVNAPVVAGSAYSLASTSCGISLAVNTSCVITVRFAPTSSSASNGTLSVNTGAGVLSASLGSTGIQGFASMSPSSLTFASQQLATSSATRVVTVTNTGTNTLTFTGVGISAGDTDYAQSNNCGTVAVNGTCTVSVSFTPSATGTRTGTLAFTHNGGGLATVSLSGNGQAPSASLSSPTFPNTQTGMTSSATATLTNTGLASINVTVPTSASVSGAGFSFGSTNCTTTLASAASCSVTVVFSATTTSPVTGTLSVGTSAGTTTAALNATGQPPKVAAPSVNNFSYNVPQNTWSGHYVAVANSGSGPLTVYSMSAVASAGNFNSWMASAGNGQVGGYCAPGFVLQPGQYCGAWANGDGANGSLHSGTVTFQTSGGDVVYSGSLTVRGLTYSTATGAAVQATVGQSGTLYNMSIINNTQSDYYLPMYSVHGGVTRIGRFTGGNSDKFVITGSTCPGKIAAYSTCTVTIAATGIATPGTYTTNFQPNGNFQQSSDGANGYWENGHWLAGMGYTLADAYVGPMNAVGVTAQSAALSLNYPGHEPGVSSIIWGIVPVGQSGASGVFTLTNTGNGPANDINLRIPDGWVAANNTCGSSLAAGSSCTLNANFTPTVAKAYTGSFLPITSTGTGAVGYFMRGTGQ